MTSLLKIDLIFLNNLKTLSKLSVYSSGYGRDWFLSMHILILLETPSLARLRRLLMNKFFNENLTWWIKSSFEVCTMTLLFKLKSGKTNRPKKLLLYCTYSIVVLKVIIYTAYLLSSSNPPDVQQISIRPFFHQCFTIN